MKIALLPGGFKPPHLGHYNMAKYLADFADNVIVRIGQKEREGIGKELALEIWSFYKEFDPDPRAKKLTISVAQSPSPVKDVYDFVETTAPEGSTVILGLGEKDASDGRYNSIPKFAEPRNIKAEIELVPPQAGGISGTRMREIIKSNDKAEFFKYIPDYLPEEIKEEIWSKLVDTTMPVQEFGGGTMNKQEMDKHNANMKKLKKRLSKINSGGDMVPVPTNLTKGLRRKLYEGRYDKLSNEISSKIFSFYKDVYDKGQLEGEKIYNVGTEKDPNNDIFSSLLDFQVVATVEITDDLYKPDGGADSTEDSPFILINFQIPKSPVWSEVSMDLKDVVRHEIEHLTQLGSNVLPGKEMEDDIVLRALIKQELLPKAEYFKLEQEVDAMLQGMYFKAKKSKTPFKQVVDDYLDKVNLTPEEKEEVLDIWKKRLPAILPQSSLDENVNLKDFTYFETSQGSKYIRKNSTTQLRRIKSYHANTGGKDMGLHGWKQQSMFIDPKFEKEANSVQFLMGKGFKKIALSKTQDGKIVLLIPKDNKWVPATWGDAYPNFAKNKPDYKTKPLAWEYKKEPTMGYHVVDFEIDSSRIIKDWHFGSPVSKIGPLSDEDAKLFKLKENYPPYKANQVQQTRYKASDTFTNDRKKAKKLGYLQEKDPKKGTGKKPKGSGRRLYTDENPKDTVSIKFSTRQDIVDTLSKKSFKAKSHARQSQIINLIHQRVRAAHGRAKDPAIKKRLKTALNYITKRKEASKRKTQRMRKEGLFSQEWWLDVITEEILNEGGAAGHMAHPFNLPKVNTGRDLIKSFEQSANSLKNEPGAVKIDGVNASIRLLNNDGKRQFAMDRGSKKALDLKGVTKADLEDRFGSGHGMVKAGGDVLDIFNEALPSIQEELTALGLFDDPNIMFNMEYVSGKSNVQDYGKNFLAIHGLLSVETKEVQGARKMLTKRITSEKQFAQSDMDELLKKLEPFAKKKGFEIYGSVPTTFTKDPDFKSALSKQYKIEFAEGAKVKSLAQWLNDVTDIPADDRIKMNLETGGTKDVGALSKQVYFAVFGGETIDDLFDNEQDIQKAIKGATTYLATEKLGDAILDVLDSPMGSVNDHEGVVIRDPKISDKPFKITGKFITGGVSSQFQAK